MNFSIPKLMASALLLFIALLFTACGGGSGGDASPAGTFTYTIGGTITGLTSAVVLQNNKGDDLTVATDGPFAFNTKVANGGPYNISVLTPPTGEVCTVSSGAGTVSASDVTVGVVCSKDAYNVKVTVTGLTGTVVLQANNGDSLIVGANGEYTFVSKIAFGSPYGVTVYSQPVGQGCSVAHGTGTMGSTDVTDIAITCASTFKIGGTVSQLNGNVVLQNNAADNLTVSANGPFNFDTTVDYGQPYNVSVITQPTNQKCLVTNGTGNATLDVGNVSVSCASQMGGAMQGIALNLTPMVSSLYVGLHAPSDLTSDGINLYVVGTDSHMINKIEIATGTVTTLAGISYGPIPISGVNTAADGPGSAATFFRPTGITTDGTSLYVSDTGNNKIRKIAPSSGTLSSMTSATAVVSSLTGVPNTQMASGATDGSGEAATFNYPSGITTDGTNLYVVDSSNNKIRKIILATGDVSSVTGTSSIASAAGALDGAVASATFNYPSGITTDGTNLYVVDAGNYKIRKISAGFVSSVTGESNAASEAGVADGAVTTATFMPHSIATDGTNLYVTDSGNFKIRKIVAGFVTSLTGEANTAGKAGGADGTAAAATFYTPFGITTDGSWLYVTDYVNGKVRKIQ